MVATNAPRGLGKRGKELWKDVTAAHELGIAEKAILTEACRTADILDRINALISGDISQWMLLKEGTGQQDGVMVIELANLVTESRQQQNVFKQLLTALRLPDGQTGQKPQYRGARGTYNAADSKNSNVTPITKRFSKGA